MFACMTDTKRLLDFCFLGGIGLVGTVFVFIMAAIKLEDLFRFSFGRQDW